MSLTSYRAAPPRANLDEPKIRTLHAGWIAARTQTKTPLRDSLDSGIFNIVNGFLTRRQQSLATTYSSTA